MKKKKFSFTAVFEGPVKNWSLKYIWKNQWRVPSDYTFDDLLQECYLCFLRCKIEYPEVKHPAHFMALVKTSIINQFNRLALLKRRRRGEVLLSDLTEIKSDFMKKSFSEIDFLIDYEQAPLPIRKIVDRIMRGQRKPHRKQKDGIKETTNQFLLRLVGNDYDIYNLRKQMSNWLIGAD